VTTTIFNKKENGVHIVGAAEDDGDYVLWQVNSVEPDSIYFEYDDQVNSGCNHVTECLIDMDGLHAVLNDGAQIHFYWNPPRHPELPSFVAGLRTIYSATPSILEVIDLA
jgi:hypothetical protein